VPIPVAGTDSVRWNAEDGAVSYDVWVAYLGFEGLPPKYTVVTSPKWNFATQDGVTSGSYYLPLDAPAGNYRIWVRPNGQETKVAWNSSTDLTSLGPRHRPLNVAVQGEKMTWEPVPGAASYHIDIYLANPLLSNSSHRAFDITATEFQIPDGFIDGAYYVTIDWKDASGQAFNYPARISIQHGTSPWTWNISKAAGSIKWNTVPDAVSYEIEILKYYNTVVTSAADIKEPHFSLSTLEPGHYEFRVRALRSVDGVEFLTHWANQEFEHGISAPANVRLDGNILKWDGQENAAYRVEVSIDNGRYGADSRLDRGVQHLIFPAPTFFSQGWIHTAANSVDLSEYIGRVYSYDRAAIVKVTVQAITTYSLPHYHYGFDSPLSSEWSEPIILPSIQPLWTDPVVERISRPAAPAPQPPQVFTLNPTDSETIGIAIPGRTILERTILFGQTAGFESSGVGGHVYRMENGAAIDVEYVKRYQLRVTNLQSGAVQTFDESHVPELMQFSDESERDFPGYYLQIASLELGYRFSPTKQLGLQTGLYRMEARIQYFPVILSASTSDPYTTRLTDTSPDRINVAATPWSDWSSSLEYTILPDGQNILPVWQSPTTINQRPTFAWGANTPNAQYELWVENRATKQRVLHETLSNVRQFQSPTDLPAGQYDWWVRIVGTTGPRNGWSAKQSLEIFAPAITTSVVAETVDATPVVSWSAATGAQNYVVMFTSTTTGKVVYQGTEAAGRTTHRVTTMLPNDTYNVSIQAILPNGARTAPGAVNASGGFVLKRITVGAAPKDVTISASKVTWKAVDAATRYDVWINYIDSTGKTERILRQHAFGTELPLSSRLTNRPGEYRVWIRAIRNEASQEYTGRWSEFKTLQVNSSSSDSSALEIVMSELAISGVLDVVASM